jgi:acetylglutamate kinase
MAGARIRVSSGNFITAKPQGVLEGIDMQLTGEVRRIDSTETVDIDKSRARRRGAAALLLQPF